VFKTSSNTFVEDTVNCPEALVLGCSLPMSVFKSTLLSLSNGALIIAKIRSKNIDGYSNYSDVSTGVVNV
jgi:hypothetical protein